jgi:sterol desaturase/sphingolipid hydroxylase (fatty acid hydroxylase superfamily)
MVFVFKSLIFFFTAVAYSLVEYLYSFIKGDKRHDDRQTVQAVHSGVVLIFTETISVLIFLFLTTKLYTYMWGDVPTRKFSEVIIAIILIDILYYFYHRLHHHNSKLFTIHKVHHVGTKYNLALAIMLPWIGQASIYIMLIPLIFLHLTPYTIITAYFFVLTYQFFCHISYLQLPKWCDYFLVTPRNHRIHHYQDRFSQSCNFGAVFSIWDRLFSTYTAKEIKNNDDMYGVSGYQQKNIFSLQKETVAQFFKK